MLLCGRDIAFGPVGQLDIEVFGKRRPPFELQSGQRINFVWQGRDAEFTNLRIPEPYRLQLHARLLPLVQDERLTGIDFLFVLRHIVLDLRGDGPRPFEPLCVWHPVFQLQRSLDHAERDVIVVLDRLQGFESVAGDSIRILLDGDRLLLCSVIHPHQVAAGALGHGGDARAVAFAGLAHFFRERFAEQAEVVGAHGRLAEVVLRVVCQHGERLLVLGPNRDD